MKIFFLLSFLFKFIYSATAPIVSPYLEVSKYMFKILNKNFNFIYSKRPRILIKCQGNNCENCEYGYFVKTIGKENQCFKCPPNCLNCLENQNSW